MWWRWFATAKFVRRIGEYNGRENHIIKRQIRVRKVEGSLLVPLPAWQLPSARTAGTANAAATSYQDVQKGKQQMPCPIPNGSP